MIQTSNGTPTTLSPRDLAKAIGVSESTVKRWVDAGRLPARRTSGGHRRIELLTALRFLRDAEQPVVQPEMLGLASSDPGLGPGLDERLQDLLLEGDEREAIRLVMTAHIVLGLPVAQLLGGALTEALDALGDHWRGGPEGTFSQRRATQIVMRILERLGSLHEFTPNLPVAVGGALEGDPSLIPSRMLATLLAAEKYQALDLGADTPVPVLLEAAEATGAKLVWVSASRISDEPELGLAVRQLASTLRNRGTRLVVCGRESARLGLAAGETAFLGQDLQPLATFVRELRQPTNGGANHAPGSRF